jgi:hypothetical protein
MESEKKADVADMQWAHSWWALLLLLMSVVKNFTITTNLRGIAFYVHDQETQNYQTGLVISCQTKLHKRSLNDL